MSALETPQKAPLRTTLTVALAGLVLVLLLAPVLFVKFVLTPEWIDEHVVPEIEAAIGREIEFEDIRLGFRGLQLKKLSISEDPAFQRDEDPQFATLDNMVLAVEFLPLLRRRVVIREIVLGDPLIVVHRNQQGVWNIASLARAADGTSSDAVATNALNTATAIAEISASDSEADDNDRGAGLSLAADDIRLQNARVIFIDEAQNGRSRVELRRVQLTAVGVSAEKPFDLDATFEVLPGNGQPIAGSLLGTIDPTAPSFDLVATTGAIDIDNIRAGLRLRQDAVAKHGSNSGNKGPSQPLHPGFNAALDLTVESVTVQGFTTQAIKLIAKLEDGLLDLSQVAVGVFEGSATGSAAFDLTEKDPRYTVQLLLEDLSLPRILDADAASRVVAKSGEFDGKLTAVGVGAPDFDAMAKGQLKPGQKFLIESVRLSEGVIGYTPPGESSPTLALTDVELSVPALYLTKASTGHLQATIVTTGSESSKLKVDALLNIAKASAEITARIDNLDIDALRAATTTGSASEGSQPKPPASAKTNTATPWEVTMVADIDKIRLGSMDGGDLHTSARYHHGVLSVDALSMDLGEGRIETSGSTKLGDASSPYDLKVVAKQLSIAQLLAPYKDSSWGTVIGKVDLEADLRGQATDNKTLNGAVQLDLSDGQFIGVPILKTLAAFTSVPELADLQFDNSGGRFSIDDGTISTKKFLLGGDDQRIIFLGEASLDGAVDLEAQIGVSPDAEHQPKLAGVADLGSDLLRSKDGWAELPIAVDGTFDSPRPSLPRRSLLEKAAGLLPKVATEKLGDEVGGLLRNLGDFFGSGDKAEPTAPAKTVP